MNAPAVCRSLVLLSTVALLLGAAHPRDKSKPVRAALNARYTQLAEAWRTKDPAAALAIRHPRFYAVQASGVIADSAAMAQRTLTMFTMVETTFVLTNVIDTIDVKGDTAAAMVSQHWVRRQQKGGQMRSLDTSARQRETWVQVAGEWYMLHVDRVVPGVWIVDGKRVDPSVPYDPDAPAFTPDSGSGGTSGAR